MNFKKNSHSSEDSENITARNSKRKASIERIVDKNWSFRHPAIILKNKKHFVGKITHIIKSQIARLTMNKFEGVRRDFALIKKLI